jgi:hypothetical protein
MKSCRNKEDAFQIFSMYKGTNPVTNCFRLLTESRLDKLPVFHPEFGRFMLESTPGKPWGIGFKDLLDVEPNMKLRFVLLTLG